MTGKSFSLYDMWKLTGIDVDCLAGMIEESRIEGRIEQGEYVVTRSAFAKWADDVISQMF